MTRCLRVETAVVQINAPDLHAYYKYRPIFYFFGGVGINLNYGRTGKKIKENQNYNVWNWEGEKERIKANT